MGADASAPVPTRLSAIAGPTPIRAHGLCPWAFTAKRRTQLPGESAAFARLLEEFDGVVDHAEVEEAFS